MNTIARSSSSRYTTASSAGSSPTSKSSASAGTSPASSVSSRAAEYFAAHPPARASVEPDRLHGDTVRKDIPPENRRLPSERSSPFSLPLTRGRRPSAAALTSRDAPIHRLATMKSALVTGGSSGIGLAIARALREDGYELTLAARRPEPLEAAAAELDALAVPANLGDADECVRVVAAHAERHGGMDVLVNCAGIGIGGSFAEQETKKIDIQLDVNLRATLVITRESLPLLRAAGRSSRSPRSPGRFRRPDSPSTERRKRRSSRGRHR